METTDHETGEVKWLRHCEPVEACDIDMETGESDSNISSHPIRKTPFVIPRELIQRPKHEETTLCCMDAHENYTLFKKEQVIGLQEVYENLFDFIHIHCGVDFFFLHFHYICRT